MSIEHPIQRFNTDRSAFQNWLTQPTGSIFAFSNPTDRHPTHTRWSAWILLPMDTLDRHPSGINGALNIGGAYDVGIKSAKRINDNEVELIFDSRYAPPIPAFVHGAKKHGFKFRMIYCDNGTQFAGIATETQHGQFQFSFDVHPQEEGVPQEIIDEFDLVAVYEEVRADEGR